MTEPTGARADGGLKSARREDGDGGLKPAAGVRIGVGDAATAGAHQAALAELLVDAVAHGASVGYLHPLDPAVAGAYWRGVIDGVGAGSHVVLLAHDAAGAVIGTAQLELAGRANSRHRAEVCKVLVHSRARRQGIGRALMLAVETEARRLGRTTLHLDTREGDPSERLYGALGWERSGAIPRWARSSDGSLHTTVFYHRLL